MRILIKDFGPIAKFEFDLGKDLHIIYGKNSIGKSYAIYCVYIILNALKKNDRFYFDDETQLGFSKLIRESIDKFPKSRVSLQKEMEHIFKIYLNKFFSDDLTQSFKNTFQDLSNLTNSLSKKAPQIAVFTDEFSMTLGFSKSKGVTVKAVKIFTQYYGNIRRKKYVIYDGKRLDFELGSESPNLFNSICGMLIRYPKFSYGETYFFPSSRSGLYYSLRSFSSILAEMSKQRFNIKSKLELPTIQEPVADYFIRLSESYSNPLSSEFKTLFTLIEEEVLHGKIELDRKTSSIIFQPNGTNLKLDLAASSSMVSEIAPFITYFKYVIGQIKENAYFTASGQRVRSKHQPTIIFIEEPEAHLHPEIQVKMMEVFAKLAKYNVKVIITSHSNYMFNKLVNMILAKELNSANVSVNHMVMGSQGSCIKEDMSTTEDGVEDHNFSETSEKLYNEREEILENFNSKE